MNSPVPGGGPRYPMFHDASATVPQSTGAALATYNFQGPVFNFTMHNPGNYQLQFQNGINGQCPMTRPSNAHQQPQKQQAKAGGGFDLIGLETETITEKIPLPAPAPVNRNHVIIGGRGKVVHSPL